MPTSEEHNLSSPSSIYTHLGCVLQSVDAVTGTVTAVPWNTLYCYFRAERAKGQLCFCLPFCFVIYSFPHVMLFHPTVDAQLN